MQHNSYNTNSGILTAAFSRSVTTTIEIRIVNIDNIVALIGNKCFCTVQ